MDITLTITQPGCSYSKEHHTLFKQKKLTI